MGTIPFLISVSEVHGKTATELVTNEGRGYGTKHNVLSQIPLQNTIADDFGTRIFCKRELKYFSFRFVTSVSLYFYLAFSPNFANFLVFSVEFS